jgi:hypothetical protein
MTLNNRAYIRHIFNRNASCQSKCKTRGLLQETRNVDHRSKNVKTAADDQQDELEWAQGAEGVEREPAKFNRTRKTTAKKLRFPEKTRARICKRLWSPGIDSTRLGVDSWAP